MAALATETFQLKIAAPSLVVSALASVVAAATVLGLSVTDIALELENDTKTAEEDCRKEARL